MAALDTELAAPPALAERVAMVRAQLAPIRSRRALLDSYRSESLFRLASTSVAPGSAADILDLAYGLRWVELEDEPSSAEPQPTCTNGLMDE
jgi:hypothetical protein